MFPPVLAALPSPSWSKFTLGPLTIHAYALVILVGIMAAIWLTARRWKARGGDPDTVFDLSIWAVPFGIVGGRIYHVVSSPAAYFGPGGNPVDAFKIWNGGLGIWGAIAFGALGAWIGCRFAKVRFTAFMDAAAPGILLAQGIGRWGNWFNQELFGGPTTLPWGLRIDPDNPNFPSGYGPDTLFHPTFLYESLWSLAGVALLLLIDRRFNLRRGRLFWLYVAYYCVGRLWIEMLRIDPAETVLGLRLNVWTSIVVLLGALVAFLALRHAPGDPRFEPLALADGTAQPEDRPRPTSVSAAQPQAVTARATSPTRPRPTETDRTLRNLAADAEAGAAAHKTQDAPVPLPIVSRAQAPATAEKPTTSAQEAPRATSPDKTAPTSKTQATAAAEPAPRPKAPAVPAPRPAVPGRPTPRPASPLPAFDDLSRIDRSVLSAGFLDHDDTLPQPEEEPAYIPAARNIGHPVPQPKEPVGKAPEEKGQETVPVPDAPSADTAESDTADSATAESIGPVEARGEGPEPEPADQAPPEPERVQTDPEAKPETDSKPEPEPGPEQGRAPEPAPAPVTPAPAAAAPKPVVVPTARDGKDSGAPGSRSENAGEPVSPQARETGSPGDRQGMGRRIGEMLNAIRGRRK